MLQPEFLRELFTLARADGLTTLIDSNGTIPFRDYPQLLEVTDGVMLDIKAFFDEDHRHVTDETNRTVLENARFLAEQGKLSEVRCVIVPDLYPVEKNIRATGEFLAQLPDARSLRIKLIAYRPMGVREEYAHYQVPDRAYLESLAALLREQGFENIIII
jgi:pyruvate formate lyase activating enzyme